MTIRETIDSLHQHLADMSEEKDMIYERYCDTLLQLEKLTQQHQHVLE